MDGQWQISTGHEPERAEVQRPRLLDLLDKVQEEEPPRQALQEILCHG